MVQFRDVLKEVLRRLRGTCAAAFLPCQSPPPAPAPVGPRSPVPSPGPLPPGWPQKPPIRLPPLLPPPTVPIAARLYPSVSNTWGLEGGFVPATTGFETRVYEPRRQVPKVQAQVRAFSIFDDLFDE